MKHIAAFGFKVLLMAALASLMLAGIRSAAPLVHAAVLYDEDFDDGAAQGWTLPSAASVSGGRLQFSTWSGEYEAVYNGKTFSGTYTYAADAIAPDTSTNWNATRIIFNYQDANNFYYLHIGNNGGGDQPALYKKVGGSVTLLGTAPTYAIGGSTVRFEIECETGGYITVRATKQGTTTVLFNRLQDGSLTSGKIGVGTRASNVSFDNVTVTSGGSGGGNGGGGTPSGTFQVVGTKILDPNGQEFIIKGVNVNGPRWPWSRGTLQDVNLIADVWQFNTVRINMYPRMAYWNIEHNMNLDEIIDAFTAKGIVSILENHDFTGTYPEAQRVYLPDGSWRPSLNELKQFWIDLANRYKDNPYVWFNPMNEPGLGNYTKQQSLAKWKDVHEELVQAIRSTGATNIIVLDGHNWGQESGFKNGPSDSAILTHGPYFVQNYDNIVFSVHVYYEWTNGEARLADYLDEAAARGLSVHIGEYGAFDNATKSAVAGMFNAAVPRNVGRIAWHWVGQDEYDLTVQGGGWQIDRTDGVKPGNLSWMGNLVWDDNRGNLTVPVQLALPAMENGGFEAGMAPWQDWGGAAIVQNPVHSGSGALRIQSGAAGGAGQYAFLEPNTTYKFSAWGRHSGAPNTATTVGVKYKVGANEPHHLVSFTETNWTYKDVIFTTPAQFTDAMVFIWKADANAAFYVDDIQLVKQ